MGQVEKIANIITMEEIRERAKGTPLEISDWDGKGTIWVRVRGVDMTPHLMKMDKMPNALKVAAVETFEGKAMDDVVKDVTASDMTEMLPIIEDIVRAVMVEPTYDAVTEVYPLTLEQKMQLFRFAMGGIEKLDSFRS